MPLPDTALTKEDFDATGWQDTIIDCRCCGDGDLGSVRRVKAWEYLGLPI